MNALRERGPWFVFWLGLLVLSLRPWPWLEAGAERLFSPLRLTAQVTLPIRWLLGAAPAEDPEARLRRGLLEESASREALNGLYLSALPTRPELSSGRRPVPAEVVSRRGEERDHLVLAPWTLVGVEVGQPVVHRNHYVGRVSAVDRRQGRAQVALVTGRDFFVGARVPGNGGESDVNLVVGGLAVRSRAAQEPETWLAAHNPSRPPPVGAEVQVHELLPQLQPASALAAGYQLGQIEPGLSDGDWRVRPGLDYLHGLFHLVVLTRPAGVEAAPAAPLHPLEEGRWVRGRALTSGDPSPWRSSVQLDVGHRRGVQVGAAVVDGARLVGRVGAVSEFGCEVRLLGDPGLTLAAIGQPLAGTAQGPRVLGRLVALGSAAPGVLDFHWRDVTLPEAQGGESPPPQPTRLLTGSGEIGLPAGLLLGVAELPTHSSAGRGHRLQLRDVGPPTAALRSLWVRVERGGRAAEVGP